MMIDGFYSQNGRGPKPEDVTRPLPHKRALLKIPFEHPQKRKGLGQQVKVALKKKGALFGHSSPSSSPEDPSPVLLRPNSIPE
jgi:hypothetical protein